MFFQVSVISSHIYLELIVFFSSSLVHIGASDGGIQHNSENDSVNTVFTSTTAAPELHSVDSTEPVKVRAFIDITLHVAGT